MQISALTDLLEGKLLNTPFISFVTQIHTQVSKINEGDAFFASNNEEIQKAIESGAFAIILEFDTKIIDKEIAWIKVDKLNSSITKILRYKLLQKNLTFTHTSNILYDMLKLLKTKEFNRNSLFLSNNLKNNFELLINENNKTVYSKDIEFINLISTNIIHKKKILNSVDNLIVHSLFEISFSYKDIFYDKIRLSKLYLNEFIEAIDILEDEENIKKISYFSFMKPIFLNKSNKIINYGQSNRFILTSTKESISKKEIAFIKENYTYAKLVILDTDNLTDEMILNNIKELNFNVLYILNKNVDEITNILNNNIPNTESLF
ncbi:MAG: hypothetical protein U9Q30_01770 [Campylobacterota bacterium]|nr:hypothetical protein [Campylobacterota bacterium]